MYDSHVKSGSARKVREARFGTRFQDVTVSHGEIIRRTVTKLRQTGSLVAARKEKGLEVSSSH
jgi:hypothetical protein